LAAKIENTSKEKKPNPVLKEQPIKKGVMLYVN